MNKQYSDSGIEMKIREVFDIPEPDPIFVLNLERQLIDRANAEITANSKHSTKSPHRRRLFSPTFLSFIRALAGGFALLLVILTVALGINTLLPLPMPGSESLVNVANTPTDSGPTLHPTATNSYLNAPENLPEGMIVFQSQRDGNNEIYQMHADGSEQINLTNDPADDSAPAWSPNGQWIAFLSDRNGKSEVFLMDYLGNQVRQLTSALNIHWFGPLSWAPNGDQIAVSGSPAGEDENHSQLYRIDLSDSSANLILSDLLAKDPKWSPDGTQLAFLSHSIEGSGTADLYLIRPDGTGLFNVTQPETGDSQRDIYLIPGYSWSPTGDKLAYIGFVKETVSGTNLFRDLFTRIEVYDLKSGKTDTVLEIQPSPTGIHGLSWSPDEKFLMYLQDEKNNGCWTIHLLPLDGARVREAEKWCFRIRTFEPDWTNDGQWLIFPAEQENSAQKTAIYALSIESILESPASPLVYRLTGETGMDINPQVKP